MKFKIDENISRRGVALLRQAGHDAVTVREEGLAGADDQVIFTAASAEDRTLVTLDYDFAQVLRFPPAGSAGIVVLELGRRASLSAQINRLRVLLQHLQTESVAGKLWIVEPGRVRMHLPSDEAGDLG